MVVHHNLVVQLLVEKLSYRRFGGEPLSLSRHLAVRSFGSIYHRRFRILVVHHAGLGNL